MYIKAHVFSPISAHFIPPPLHHNVKGSIGTVLHTSNLLAMHMHVQLHTYSLVPRLGKYAAENRIISVDSEKAYIHRSLSVKAQLLHHKLTIVKIGKFNPLSAVSVYIRSTLVNRHRGERIYTLILVFIAYRMLTRLTGF